MTTSNNPTQNSNKSPQSETEEKGMQKGTEQKRNEAANASQPRDARSNEKASQSPNEQSKIAGERQNEAPKQHASSK